MGFYIQDDYFYETAAEMTEDEQDRFFGALVRRYFCGTDEADELESRTVRTGYRSVKGRVDMARKEADRKRKYREEQEKKEAGQSVGQSDEYIEGQSDGQSGGQSNEKSTDKSRPSLIREREGEREIDNNNVVFNPVFGNNPNEISYEPPGFNAFVKSCVSEYNKATGQSYAYPTVASRQGMLEAFNAGRTIDDVKRVLADVSKWERKYQTLDAVFANGRFEKHMNRPRKEDKNEYSYLDELPASI